MAICSPLIMPFRSHLTHNLVQTSAFFFLVLFAWLFLVVIHMVQFYYQ